MTKKHIVISAIHFPLTMARYFWNALEHRDDVVLHVVGPFSGTYIPWNNGMHLDQRHVKTPHFPLPMSAINQRVPASMIDAQLDKDVDLWLDIDAGWCIDGRPNKTKVYVQIQTDPHVLKDRYNKVKAKYDKVFCMQNCYRTEDEIYLPYAYDSSIHYPESILGQDKVYDVCMIGLAYQQRAELVKRLMLSGVVVKFDIGIVYDEYRHEYNKSKIAVSWSSLNDLPARVWEGMAMGLPVVTNRVPDLTLFFSEGIHYLGFDTIDEAFHQVHRLLGDIELRKTISMNGYERVKPETWDARIEFIMKECRL